MQNHFTKILNSLTVNFLFILSVMIVMYAKHLPNSNELLYLLLPIKQYNTNFLLNDWTLSEPWRSHYIFNSIVGVFTLFLPIKIIGWFGRFFCWVLSMAALLRIGKHFRLPLWLVSLSIFLWLVYGQSIVAGEYIFGGFEAKSVAYVFLLFALDAFIKNKKINASVLLGLTFSFNPAVGLAAILSILLSLIFLGYSPKDLLKAVTLITLFSLPGVIPLLPEFFNIISPSSDHWKFLALVRMPHHLDPLSWPKRDLLFLYILLLFNWLQYKKYQNDQVVKFLTYFQLFLALLFSFGIVLRLTENYALLKFMPFRLFPVFTLLFFFFQLMQVFHDRFSFAGHPALIAVGFVALLSFGNPFGSLVDEINITYHSWTRQVDELEIAFKWIEANTRNGAVCILPPWRRDSWYLTERAQIVSFPFFSYDSRIPEWRERLELIVGRIDVADEDEQLRMMESHYNTLPENTISLIARKYGADYLVSKSMYSYPIVYETGTYKIYYLNRNQKNFEISFRLRSHTEDSR